MTKVTVKCLSKMLTVIIIKPFQNTIIGYIERQKLLATMLL